MMRRLLHRRRDPAGSECSCRSGRATSSTLACFVLLLSLFAFGKAGGLPDDGVADPCIFYVRPHADPPPEPSLLPNSCRYPARRCTFEDAALQLENGTACSRPPSAASPAQLWFLPGVYELPCVRRRSSEPQSIVLTRSVVLLRDPEAGKMSPEAVLFHLADQVVTDKCNVAPILIRPPSPWDGSVLVAFEDVSFIGRSPFVSDLRAGEEEEMESIPWGNVSIQGVRGDGICPPKAAGAVGHFVFNDAARVDVVDSYFVDVAQLMQVRNRSRHNVPHSGGRRMVAFRNSFFNRTSNALMMSNWREMMLILDRTSFIESDYGMSSLIGIFGPNLDVWECSVRIEGCVFENPRRSEGERPPIDIRASSKVREYYRRGGVVLHVRDTSFWNLSAVMSVTVPCSMLEANFSNVTLGAIAHEAVVITNNAGVLRGSFNDCVFERNVGTVLSLGGNPCTCDLAFERILAVHNQRADLGSNLGGVVSARCSYPAGHLRVSNSSFLRNSASSGGGAMSIVYRLYQSLEPTPTAESGLLVDIFNSSFVQNRGDDQGGGGILVSADAFVVVRIRNSTFHKNQAEGGSGGACFIRLFSDGEVSIAGVEFFGNEAAFDGGAVAVEADFRSGAFLVADSSFRENVAWHSGAAILFARFVAYDPFEKWTIQTCHIARSSFVLNRVDRPCVGRSCGSIVQLDTVSFPEIDAGELYLTDCEFQRNSHMNGRLHCVVCVVGYRFVMASGDLWNSNFAEVTGIHARFFGSGSPGKHSHFKTTGSSVVNATSFAAVFLIEGSLSSGATKTSCHPKVQVDVHSLAMLSCSGGGIKIGTVHPSRRGRCAFEWSLWTKDWWVSRHRDLSPGHPPLLYAVEKKLSRWQIDNSTLSYEDGLEGPFRDCDSHDRSSSAIIVVSETLGTVWGRYAHFHRVSMLLSTATTLFSQSSFRFGRLCFDHPSAKITFDAVSIENGRGMRLLSFKTFTAVGLHANGNGIESSFGGALRAKFSNRTLSFSIDENSTLHSNTAKEGGAVFLSGDNSKASIEESSHHVNDISIYEKARESARLQQVIPLLVLGSRTFDDPVHTANAAVWFLA